MPVSNEPPVNERAGLLLLQKVQGESVKIRAALQGLVQAHSLKRARPGSRGRLDSRRLHRLPLGEFKVFQRPVSKAAPNTAIHLLLDKSESMGYPVPDTRGQPMGTRLPVALEATLALALAFEGIAGVNPGITAFPGNQDGAVYRLLAHGQRVGSRAGAFSLAPTGCTPMTEAVWFGAAALLRCRDSGIETVGIGLGIDVSHLFPAALAINELQELRTQLFKLSKAVLLAA
jgi:cobalamin biosynthesis protein CobT